MPRRAPYRTLAILLTLAAVLTAGATSNIRVKQGDTLWELAQRHHTTVAVLRQLNNLPGNGMIYIGELLKVPGSAPHRPRTHTVEKGYTVRPGDNLTVIARRYGVSVRTIEVRNKLPRSGVVVIGRRLAIPVRVSSSTRTRTAARPNSDTYNAGLRIPLRVQRSTAQHRAYLSRHRQPSKAYVRRLVYRTAQRVGLAIGQAVIGSVFFAAVVGTGAAAYAGWPVTDASWRAEVRKQAVGDIDAGVSKTAQRDPRGELLRHRRSARGDGGRPRRTWPDCSRRPA